MVDLTPAQRAALEWLPVDGVLISGIPGKHFDAIAFLRAAGLTKGERVKPHGFCRKNFDKMGCNHFDNMLKSTR